MRFHILVLVCCAVMAGVPSSPAQATVVTELDIAGGSISLNFGSLGTVGGNFVQNGTLVMGQYQPLPNIFSPVQVSHLTLSAFTNSGQPAVNLPAPSGSTSGNTMTVDLASLFGGLSSTQWGSWMTPPTFGALNIGGTATGSFNEITQAFDISWTHGFTGLPFLTGATFSLRGTAQVAAVPLPAAALLFGSGLLGVMPALRRRYSSDDDRRALMQRRREMMRIRQFQLMAAVASLLLFGSSAMALELSPGDFSSLGTLDATGDVVINSDTLQLTGGATFTGVLDATSHAAVFTFDTIQAGNISIIGTNPLALLSKGTITFTGPVTVSIPNQVEIATPTTMTLTSLTMTGQGTSLSIFAETINAGGGSGSDPVTVTPPIIPVLGPGNLILVPAVPVPAAAVLFATGVAGLGAVSTWRKRANSR